MSLPKPNREGYGASDSNKLEYLKLTEGQHVIRMLSPISEVTMKYTHWIAGTSIECLGAEECPICISNQKILNDVDGDWKSAKEITGFNPYQTRYYVNVLDKTPVKVHPQSEKGFENKKGADGQFPALCGDTGLPLADVPVKLSGKVKVFSGGVTIFNTLDGVDAVTNTDSQGNPLEGHGIQNYDVTLMVDGTGRDRKISAIPQATWNDPVDFESLELHDLDRALIKLTKEEIPRLISGVSLRDIFAARRQDDSVSTDVSAEAEAVANVASDVQNSVDELLNG